MKIAHIFWGLTFGGIETMLVNIANAQAAAGHDVAVMIINDFAEPTLVKALSPKVRFYCAGRRVGSRNPLWLLRLNARLWRDRPDIVHIHGSELLSTIFIRRLSRGACVSTLHDLPSGTVRRGGFCARLSPLFSLLNAGNTTLIDRVPHVCAISQAVHDELLARYGVESTVVCNGIRTELFRRRQGGTMHGPLRVVQVSRLEHDKKGQDLLIEAVAKANADIDLTFVGDGSSMDYLRGLAAERGIAGRTHFAGKQVQSWIADHLADFDIFVQASRYEGFGLTVAEAMAAGVPVLVSSGQGPAEVCRGDEFGWTFTNGDAADLCRKIEHIAANYPEAEAKAEKGREHVLAMYDVSRTAERYVEEYRKTIEREKL